jgi:hypothetical protein
VLRRGKGPQGQNLPEPLALLQPQEAAHGQRHRVGPVFPPSPPKQLLQARPQAGRVAVHALHQAAAVQVLAEQREPRLVVARLVQEGED